MIHHYINLVSWRPMPQLYDPSRDAIWIDSISMRLLAAPFRSGLVYRPGTTMLSRIGPGSQNAGKWFFLPAMELSSQPPETQFVLPFFEEISVPDDLKSIILGLESGTRVGLGISSPKQNLLAVKLHALRPDLEYHCLGAALVDLDRANGKAARRPPLAGSGFEWLRFFLNSPRRTFVKQAITYAEIFRILLQSQKRAKFRKFVGICMSHDHGR